MKKTTLALALLALFGVWQSVSAQERIPYAKLEGNTLTFYYDTNKSQASASGTVYDIPWDFGTTAFNHSHPGWYNTNEGEDNLNTTIQSVAFDASFSDYQLVSAYDMFYKCTALTSIDFTNFNTSSIVNMSYMFSGCTSLQTLDLTAFNTENVEYMIEMFSGCSNLSTIYCNKDWNTHPISSDNMFSGCVNLRNYSDYNNNNISKANPDWSGYFTLLVLPYAVLNNGTLTFYYDTNKSEASGTVYDIPWNNLDANGNNYPLWASENISKVIIDPYFIDYQPTSTAYLFSCLGNATSITGIQFLNTSEVTSMEGMFKNSSNLESLELLYLNTENVENMESMFDNCSALTSLDLTNFNISSVTNMDRLFYGCQSLNNIYCNDDWSIVNQNAGLTSSEMFSGCVALPNYSNDNVNDITFANPSTGGYFTHKSAAYAVLDDEGTLTFYYDESKATRDGVVSRVPWNSGDPDDWNEPDWVNYDSDANGVLIGNTDIKSVAFDASFSNYSLESAYGMFSTCTALTSIDFTNFNTSNVKSMSGMFIDCRSLTTLNLSSFDTDQVKTMEAMFAGCSALTDLTLGDNFNTESVNNMFGMFIDCSGLTSIDLSTFNTETVYDMSYMFDNCESLTSLDLSKFDTGEVTATEYMFHNCTSLTSLDLTNFDMSNVIFAGNMFFDCSNLKTIFCNDNWYRESFYSSGMFSGCISLQGAISYDEFKTDALYANPTDGYFTSNVKQAFGVLDNGKLTFYYAPKSIVDVSLPILDFDLTNPAWTTLNYINQIVSIEFSESFQEYEDLNSIAAIFAGMTSLTEVTGLHNLNTSHVTSMSYLFEGCSALETLDLSGLNTSSVTDMSGMFYGCTALRALDLTGWDVSNVSSMYSMFVDCQKLSRIYCNDDWTLVFNENPTVEEMFYKAGENLPFTSSDGTLQQLKPTTEGGIFIKREAYAVVSEGNLTFYHDANKPAQGTVYGIDHNGAGDWKNANYTTITFDDSFKSFKLWTTANMFNGLSALTTIYGLSNLNISCVTDMSGMFSGCSSLTTIYCNDDWSASGKVESSDNMFAGCAVSNGANDDVASAKPTSGGYFTTYAAPYAVRVDKWTLKFQYGNPPAEGTIYDVVRADFYPDWRHPLSDDEPYAIITSVIFDPSFAGYHGLTSTANMFSDLSNLSSITDLEYLDTENVTDMSEMFSGCASLGNLTFSESFNTSKVTDMREMFSDCASLSELDLTKFNTAEVIDMRRMFNYCTNLTTIWSNSDWSIHEAIGRYDFSSYQMFTDCVALQGGFNMGYSEYNDNDITFARPDDQYHSGYFTSTGTLLDITLYDGQSNAQTISDNLSMLTNVTLSGRTLSTSGVWNTLCLPFSLTAGQLAASPLAGYTELRTLNEDESSFESSTGTLTLNFTPATGNGAVTSIEAGKPYIIKWNSGENIENPTFNGITIDNRLNPVEAPGVTFMGTYDPQPFTSADDDILYLGNNNNLYFPNRDMTINSFRAWFQLTDGTASQIKAINLNFGDEENGIKEITTDSNLSNSSDTYFSLDGLRLLEKPTQKGMYINNGRKVLIK